jgi:hypothetical protein
VILIVILCAALTVVTAAAGADTWVPVLFGVLTGLGVLSLLKWG